MINRLQMFLNQGDPTLSRVSDEIKKISYKYQFNYDLVNRMIFYYGLKRATELIESLLTYQSEYSIRINTHQTSKEKLLETLNSKKIPAKEHPVLEDCLLISVDGPKDIKEKAKAVKVLYSKPVHNILIGASLGARDFVPISEEITIGDDVTIFDELGNPVANGILMMSLKDVKYKKRGIAIKVTDYKYQIPNLNVLKEYLRGHFIHQNIPRIIIGAQIKLKPRDRVLDMNVGQGEILSHIWQNNQHLWENDKSQKKKNAPLIIALESSTKFTKRLNDNMKRLRIHQPFFDLQRYSLKRFTEKYSKDETFDWIILNLQSSNIGLRPKLYGHVKEKSILEFAYKQRKYLTQAARLIKPGGTIFYLTNSLDPAENENNIQYAVEELGLKVIKSDFNLGSNDINQFEGAEHLQYFYPDVHNTDGQFLAKLSK